MKLILILTNIILILLMKRIHLLFIIIMRQLLNSHQIIFIYYNIMYSVHCKTFAENITVPFSELGKPYIIYRLRPLIKFPYNNNNNNM